MSIPINYGVRETIFSRIMGDRLMRIPNKMDIKEVRVNPNLYKTLITSVGVSEGMVVSIFDSTVLKTKEVPIRCDNIPLDVGFIIVMNHPRKESNI